ncbi:MAG: tRNA (adenosine(37)-N6)-threonylcarbamoyltransferase complex ATPase subunit type 1 TsaE [Pseudomonadota bacterium]
MTETARALAYAPATAALGAALARAILASERRALLVLLEGDLGAGKTTFARGFLRGCGHTGPVPSPTYTLVEPYHFEDLDVHHLDLYRLAGDAELEFIGWRDLADSVRLVEWPERAPTAMRDADLKITLTVDGVGRRARIAAASAAGQTLLAQLDAAGD